MTAAVRREAWRYEPPPPERDAMRVTQREYDVAFVARPGRRVKEMAALLGISPHTVQKHLVALAAKFGDGGSALATVLYYRARILESRVPVITPDED